MPDNKVLNYFDNIDNEGLLLINLAYFIIILPTLLSALILKEAWLLYTSAFVGFLWLIWDILFLYSRYKLNKEEKELLVNSVSFPQHDFCDFCGAPLDNVPAMIDGDTMIIFCPSCKKENIIKGEK